MLWQIEVPDNMQIGIISRLQSDEISIFKEIGFWESLMLLQSPFEAYRNNYTLMNSLLFWHMGPALLWIEPRL
jgi:hypothetical protein